MSGLSIDQFLSAARSRIRRYSPSEALEAFGNGGILVDIGPIAQRREFGEIPGAIVVERNVLEWRLDRRSDARLVDIARSDAEIILLCQQGYASSLAARSVRELGLALCGDLIGGFSAWRQAGLPTFRIDSGPGR